MHRRWKIILILLIVAVLVTSYFYMPYIRQMVHPDLILASSGKAIPFSQEEFLHFYKDGMVLCGSPSRFYSWDGAEQKSPFEQEDVSAEGEKISIVAHSKHYIVTAGNRIYNTQTVPFSKVYENKDLSIWDIKECGDFLLLLVKNKESIIEPLIFARGEDSLLPLDGMGDAKFLSADSPMGEEGNKDLSLLTMSMDNPVPFSRIFHFVNRNELFGVLSLKDQLLYNIYRLRDTVVLMGNRDILCYNVNGKQKWSIKNNFDGKFDAIHGKDGLLLYFPNCSDIEKEKGNGLTVNNSGEYSVKIFPKYLTNLQPYQNGYLGLEYGRTVVFLGKKGEILKKQNLKEPVNAIEINPYQSERLYVRTKNNDLQIYTPKKQGENKK